MACPSYEEVCADKTAYARATKIQYDEHDPIRGCAVLQPCQGRVLVVNPPARPLSREALDALYDLPYVREVHPMYREEVPAIEEVRFSITHNRGCFGGCNFCALAFHQGRMVTSRSIESVVREAELLTQDPKFKAISTMWEAPPPTSATPPAPSRSGGGCARAAAVWPRSRAGIWTPTTRSIRRFCSACGGWMA